MRAKNSTSDPLTEKTVAAMKEAVDRVVKDHRLRRKPLAVWRNGEVAREFPIIRDEVRETAEQYEAVHSSERRSGKTVKEED